MLGGISIYWDHKEALKSVYEEYADKLNNSVIPGPFEILIVSPKNKAPYQYRMACTENMSHYCLIARLTCSVLWVVFKIKCGTALAANAETQAQAACCLHRKTNSEVAICILYGVVLCSMHRFHHAKLCVHMRVLCQTPETALSLRAKEESGLLYRVDYNGVPYKSRNMCNKAKISC